MSADLLNLYNRAMSEQLFGGGWNGPVGSTNLWSEYDAALNNQSPASGTGTGYSTTGLGGVHLGGGVPGSTASSGSGGSTPFTLNPAPTSGQGAFGAVPGQIGAPPSPWQESQSAVPGLGALTAQETSLIGSQLAGQISPTTTQSLTDSAASRGVTLGQPGGAQVNQILLNTLGLTSEQLQQQGNQNYLGFEGAVAGQQLSPDLLTEIASRNATMAAAPDPTQAGELQIALAQGGQGRSPASGSVDPFAGLGILSNIGGPPSPSNPFAPTPTTGAAPISTGSSGSNLLPGLGADNYSQGLSDIQSLLGIGTTPASGTGDIYNVNSGVTNGSMSDLLGY